MTRVSWSCSEPCPQCATRVVGVSATSKEDAVARLRDEMRRHRATHAPCVVVCVATPSRYWSSR